MAKTEVTARKRLFWPIVLLLLSVLPTLYWDSLIHEIGVDVISQTIKIAKYSIATISWLSVAWLAIRLMLPLVTSPPPVHTAHLSCPPPRSCPLQSLRAQ